MSQDRSDKFTLSPAGTVLTQCVYCKHLISGPFGAGCGAFPSAIPEEIVTNRFDHRRPHPDEIDPYRFTPRDDLPPVVLKHITAALDAIP